MECIYCGSSHVQKYGNKNGFQRYKCVDCRKRFNGEKYEIDNNYIIHFKTRLKKTDRNLLTRENYCIPKKELGYEAKKIALYFAEKNKLPNEIYEDTEHYTNECVKSLYKKTMENFDLNMNYFAKLDHDEFDEYLMKFIKKHGFTEIDDLNIVNNIKGIYILVLDKYNQVYIGISESSKGIKNRILQHWSKKMEFSHLVYGNVDTSVIAIDSFGTLDTTRIFYKELNGFQNINEYEDRIVEKFKKDYRLNRIDGGLNGEEQSIIRNMKILSSRQERTLK